MHMRRIRFEWDERKNKSNERKHGVSFEEAQTAFADEEALVFFDPDHSEEEDRFILVGMTGKLRVVVVCHCLRENEEVIRLISARLADDLEEKRYWRFGL